MTDIRAKVAYLQGLAEGLDIDIASAEGRVLTSMIDVLGDIADEMISVCEAQVELSQYVEDVDYDLGALEETIYTEDEDDESIVFVPENAIISEEDGVELLICPECGETLAAGSGHHLEADIETVCPSCGCIVIDGGLDYNDDRFAEHD